MGQRQAGYETGRPGDLQYWSEEPKTRGQDAGKETGQAENEGREINQRRNEWKAWCISCFFTFSLLLPDITLFWEMLSYDTCLGLKQDLLLSPLVLSSKSGRRYL